MTIECVQAKPETFGCRYVAVGVVSGVEHQPPATVALNRAAGGAIAAQLKLGGVLGAQGEVVPVAASGLAAEAILLVGLGEAGAVDAEAIRRAMGHATRWVAARGGGQCASLLHRGVGERATAQGVGAAVTGAVMGSFRSPRPGVSEASSADTEWSLLEASRPAQALHRAAARALAIAGAANTARALAETPGNFLPPKALASKARQAVKDTQVKCTVRDARWLKQQKMGLVLGVGQGSSQPPYFVELRYRPRAAKRHIVLVGKGVTFDTGGISLKPRDGMERMKYDMAGAACVIGTMQAVSQLGCHARVTGLIPTVENMPDGNAIRPGDVLVSAAGKTIEITNTDAEGRLILADALHYGSRLKPDHMIDVATLTGACKMALGDGACGLMSTDSDLQAALEAAGERAGEPAWPLPLYDGYLASLDSAVADLKNSGSRWGGAMIAGKFLETFAGDTSWAHLDIAGVGWCDRDRGFIKDGASGYGVRLLAEFLGL